MSLASRGVRLFVFAMLFGLLLVGGAPVASAEPPFRLPGQITDQVQALTDDQRVDVQGAIDSLYNGHRVRLWVVYVTDFGGQTEQAWAQRTAQLSSLGNRDALLAIATVDRSYALDAPSLPGLTQDEVNDLRINAVEPALREDDWAGAAIATASGLSDALASTPGRGGVGLSAVLAVIAVIAVVALMVIGLGVLVRRRRSRARAAQDAAAARTVDPFDTEALAALPIPALHARSREVLVELDNALRTSAEEIDLARGEFGDEAVRPFDNALTNAKTALAHAFAIRQQLDDAIPEPLDQQRDLLVDLIHSCAVADRELDARVDEFDEMRNLLIDAPERLDALTQQIVELTVRIPVSAQTLEGLRKQFPPSVLEPIRANVDMARNECTFAEQSVAAARQTVSLPPGKQGPVVGAIRSAEGGVAHARELLDAVDRAADDIRSAIAALPGLIDEVRRDIAAAAELETDTSPNLASARVHAEAALARAESGRDANPLGVYSGLLAADVELDKEVAAATDRKRAEERVRRHLEQTLTAASAQIAAAADFIATRRGAIASQARTKLAEGQQRLAQAQQLQTSDPEQALEHARAAAELGSRALLSAQADVEQWSSTPQASGAGNAAGAVLGGILIDSMLRGGFSGGMHGRRYRSGGAWRMGSPGSFGGPSATRRIGGGGRF